MCARTVRVQGFLWHAHFTPPSSCTLPLGAELENFYCAADLGAMSTKKRDELMAIQDEVQQLWEATHAFEVDAPAGEGQAKAE